MKIVRFENLMAPTNSFLLQSFVFFLIVLKMALLNGDSKANIQVGPKAKSRSITKNHF